MSERLYFLRACTSSAFFKQYHTMIHAIPHILHISMCVKVILSQGYVYTFSP